MVKFLKHFLVESHIQFKYLSHTVYIRQWRIQDLSLGGAWTLSTGGGGGGRKIIESVNIWLISPILECFGIFFFF